MRQNRLAFALGIAVVIGGLAAPLRAGEEYVRQFNQCKSAKILDADLEAIDPITDPGGHAELARIFAECGVETAERWAAGDFFDPDGPDAATTNKSIKRLSAILRKVRKLGTKGGEARTKLAKKAHLKSADPRFFAGDGIASHATNVQLHAALAEQQAALEVALLEEVARYDAQATESGTKGEQRALKFVALANLFVQRSRGLAEAAKAQQQEVIDAINGGSPAADHLAAAKALRGKLAEAYDLLAAAQKSANKAQKAFTKELDRQRKNVQCTLTDPDVPFQGGGTVTLSVDGGPVQVLENGTAGISIFRKDKKYFSVGTKTGQYPRIKLFHEGIHFRGKGTYPVTRKPFDFSDPTPYKPTHAKGHYWSGTSFRDSDFHTTDSGTFTVTKYVLKQGKRRIVGTYDVMMSTDEGQSVRLTGTFDVCGFQIETRDGID